MFDDWLTFILVYLGRLSFSLGSIVFVFVKWLRWVCVFCFGGLR